MPFYCYMLECEDGSLYTGWSTDPIKREIAHSKGLGAAYTRLRKPTKLVYVESLPDRSSALKRELAIKKLDHKQKLALLNAPANLLEELKSNAPS